MIRVEVGLSLTPLTPLTKLRADAYPEETMLEGTRAVLEVTVA